MQKEKIDFAIGGQAVIEGVMMRSPHHVVVSVRKESGKIKSKHENFLSLTQKHKIFSLPVLRGMVGLIEMMIVGYRALNFSANESVEENPKEKHEKTTLENIGDIILMLFSIILALAIGIFLFKFVPLSLAEFLSNNFPLIKENYVLYNIIDGITKTLIFVGYIWVISLAPTFKRVFEYHGAEHKAVYAYEKGLKLTVQNAKKQIRFHPRCGTSFVFVVFAISILIYTLFPKLDEFYLNLTLRVALLPVIAGVAYEALKLSAKHTKKWWVKVLIAPGLWFQRITTREPNEAQLEVALDSLEKALEQEGKGK
ncbi:MAG: DUF1385 domain-containing protein [Patescibacteria group bacterium]